jgi:hypothetical protein
MSGCSLTVEKAIYGTRPRMRPAESPRERDPKKTRLLGYRNLCIVRQQAVSTVC